MTTFSIRRSLCRAALIGSVLTASTLAWGCETIPAADPPDSPAPKTHVAPKNDPPKRPHTAGRDFDTIY
ncbi:MAG TPA: hypothetical protein VKK61_08805 [Tepidisphaeraceae bacterium]|nr:hypothetical protein [Tepidisphaeraceae bacterium]